MGIMHSIGTLLVGALQLYSWILIIRVLLSWVNPDPRHPLVQLLLRMTEPVLQPLRRWIPPLSGLDLSPLLALFLLTILQRVLDALFSSSPGRALMLFINELNTLIHLLGTLYFILLAVRSGINIYSWFYLRRNRPSGIDLAHPLVRFVLHSTNPVLHPIRRWLPVKIAGLDLSPLVAAAVVLLGLLLLQELSALLAAARIAVFF
ncbi:MAG: YggT family protein [Magnetococcales bacterium]|nr:YggT family protein [Magnetococcales bacterium]